MSQVISILDVAGDILRPTLIRLYKQKRPEVQSFQELPNEYIVINTLPITDSHISFGVLNVNVYVRDSNPAKKIPNLSKLGELSAIIITEMKDMTVGTIHFSYQQAAMISENELSSHYINLRFVVNILN
jgi:hypothetical protein